MGGDGRGVQQIQSTKASLNLLLFYNFIKVIKKPRKNNKRLSSVTLCQVTIAVMI